MNLFKNKFFNSAILAAFCLSLALGTFVGLDFSMASDGAFAAETASGYYASLENETSQGAAFRTKLAQILKDTHTRETSYDDLKTVYKTTDKDPNKSGNIIWFYTGTSVAFSGNFNGGTNREHVWPKNGGKAFPASSKAGSDAHHLRPCNANLNSKRGSYGYDEVPQIPSNIVEENGSTSYGNLCYLANGTFYPGEGYRGATARILMYVQTRWGTEYSLKFVDGQGHNKTIGSISTLMKWHLEEPPTEEEYRRNEEVYKIQGNRNPFIDHPEYAARIYCYDGESYNSALQTVVNTYGDYEGTDVESISFGETETTVAVGESTALTVSVTPSSAAANVLWTSSDNSVATVANGTVKGLKQGTVTITATAANDSNIKASITVKVIGVSSVTVTGTPTKTSYVAGEKFNPQGLTVTVTYSDGSTKTPSVTTLKWLDATTKTETLTAGTTSVILSFGGIEKTVSGITVKAATTKTVSFDRSSVSGSGTYNWNNWTAGEITGKVYSYPGNKNQIQMNNNKSRQCYLFNDKALTGGIRTITIKVSSGKKWELRTSKTPFDTSANPYPTTGTSHGEKTATSDGITWTVNTTDEYFALCYKDSGAVYVDSVEMTYGSIQQEECSHTFGEWQTVTEATEDAEGLEKRVCSKCNEEETRSIPKLPCSHNFGEWQTVTEATEDAEGLEKRTCSKCNEEETRSIPKLPCSHTFGEWQTVTEATEDAEGLEKRVCSKCNAEETRSIPKLPCSHTFGEWQTVTEATEDAEGLEKRTCSKCNEEETRSIPKLPCSHTFGGWQTVTEATEDAEGLEKRTCSKCNEEETRSIPKLAAGGNFQKAVDAIADATTTEEKQAAIDNAMQEYDKLSPADQAKMHDSYLKLQEYIDDLSGGDSDGGKVKPYVWAILGIIGGAALVFAICYARSRRRKA